MATQEIAFHALTSRAVLERLEVDDAKGVSRQDVEERRAHFGSNQLQEAETRPWWRVLAEQLRSVVVYLLGAAAILAFVTQRWAEGMAVLAVIAVNTGIGFVTEWRAVRSMAALRKMGEHQARVRREGDVCDVATSEIVVGDIVLVDEGDVVPADLRLLRAERLRVNEAALTGESLPADKLIDPVAEKAELADRQDMLYRGTSIATGSAEGIVVATGARTELGRISDLAQTAESSATPLQQRLDALGRRLAWITLAIAGVVAAVGVLVRHQETALVVETAIALGIAAIPEGLPIVATIALARGMWLMAERNALVNRLTAVETLGATRIIFTDKTGTLTENRMKLRRVVALDGEAAFGEGGDEAGDVSALCRRTVLLGVLCNGASLEANQSEDNPKGDPTETAILAGGVVLGLERDELLQALPQVRVEEFEPRTKKMATVHRDEGRFLIAVKGGPRAVLEACDSTALGEPLDEAGREHWRDVAGELASEGLRVLAMAERTAETQDVPVYERLSFVGLVGLHDPPRHSVRAAIDACQAAGIRVEMVTGDQPRTALAIAEAVGIIGGADDPEGIVMRGSDIGDDDVFDEALAERIRRANIFARVSPEQKLRLISAYQERGEVVAMTGDGVNDAPALKKADIGIAMGKRGTEAARQVADMVLRDDAFETIVAAVAQGRVIFANIRRSVMFMLCTNVAEVIAVALATAAGWTLPLRPLQILYLNVLTDVFPALALGLGKGSGREMEDPPRDPGEAVLTSRHWVEIIGWAAVIATCVLAGLLLAQHWLGFDERGAVTVAFLTLAFGKLWFTSALRAPKSGVFRNEITRNPWVWGAIALCIILLLAAVYVPFLSTLLETAALPAHGWALLLGLSLVPFVLGQIVRQIQKH